MSIRSLSYMVGRWVILAPAAIRCAHTAVSQMAKSKDFGHPLKILHLRERDCVKISRASREVCLPFSSGTYEVMNHIYLRQRQVIVFACVRQTVSNREM